MSQACCVCLKFLAFFVIFILPVFLAYPVNEYFKKIASISSKYPQYCTKLFQYLDRHRQITLEQNTKPPEYTSSELDSDKEYETSCGQLTCDNVKDYPEDVIERAFFEKYGNKLSSSPFRYDVSQPFVVVENRFKTSEEVLETDNFNNFLNIKEVKADYPTQEVSIPTDSVKENEPDITLKSPFLVSTSMNDILHSINEYLNTDRRTCQERIEMSHPREGLNLEYEAVLIVNTEHYRITVRHCKAGKFCQDFLTPDNYAYSCNSKIKHVSLETYNALENTITSQVVQVPNGCDCRLVRRESNSTA